MNVGQLIARLKQLPQDLPVFKSKDDEGNGFDKVDRCVMSSYSDYDEIEIGLSKLTDELREKGYSEEDVKEHPCVCLW